jgi:hypothetical protein
MTKRIEVPKSVTSYAYVGLWDDGQIGWCLPSHANKYDTVHSPAPATDRWEEHAENGDRAYICRITVEQILDSLGRPITRVKLGDP